MGRLKEGWVDGKIDGRAGGLMDRLMEGWVDGQIDGRMGWRTD